MFLVRYAYAELTRRRARTVLAVLALAVGVAVVVGVGSAARAVDEAQREVLDPLGTLGTDLTLTRPVQVGGGGLLDLGPEEQALLEAENGTAAFEFDNLGDPGEPFERDVFLPATQLTFPEEEAARAAQIDGVEAVAAGLTVVVLHQEGLVPAPEDLAEAQRLGPAALNRLDFTFDTWTMAGIDPEGGSLALAEAGQVSSGRFLEAGERGAVLASDAWAARRGIEAGDELRIAGREYTVVGTVRERLGAQAADAYLPLAELQELAEREGRINLLAVRAERSELVGDVEEALAGLVDGAQVGASADVADRVSGSLVDAADLSAGLARVVLIVSLIAAAAIAVLVTLGSVSQRTREIGTLRAIGWSPRRVVGQVLGESLVIGTLGALVGSALGAGAVWLVARRGIELEASGASAPAIAGLESVPAAFGIGELATVNETISVVPQATPELLLAGGLLALGAGLVAGLAGAWRAARIEPAEALRRVG